MQPRRATLSFRLGRDWSAGGRGRDYARRRCACGGSSRYCIGEALVFRGGVAPLGMEAMIIGRGVGAFRGLRRSRSHVERF